MCGVCFCFCFALDAKNTFFSFLLFCNIFQVELVAVCVLLGVLSFFLFLLINDN